MSITDSGQAALDDTLDWYDGVLDRALAAWTPEEITALSTALGRFTSDVDAAITDT